MRLEWRNDPQMNGMILLRREYQDGMTECSRMREFSDLRVLPWIKKLSSFGLIRSFQHHSRMTEWSGNDQNDCWMLSSHCNFHSLSFKSDMEWRNEVEWGGFRRRRKKMNSEMPVIPPYSVIPSSFRNSNKKLSSRLSMEWFEWYWNDWNEQGMTEWQWNDGRVNAVTGISELRVLPLFKNLPSFDLIRSFQHRSWMTKLIGMKWKWPEWLLNDIYPL